MTDYAVAAAPPVTPASRTAQGTRALVAYLQRRKRIGLAHAVTNLTGELAMVGLVSLLLIVLQGPLSSICGETLTP